MELDDAEALFALQRESYARAGPGLRASWPERQALDVSGFRDLLSRRRYAVLASTRSDGRPHAAPIAFLVRHGVFWIGSIEGARLRNLRARPWASLVVIEGEADAGEEGLTHRAITLEGPVTIHEGEAFEPAWRRLEEQWLSRFGHAPDWAVALIELQPRVLYSHSAA